jgi:CRP-like cAMP-binding protein
MNIFDNDLFFDVSKETLAAFEKSQITKPAKKGEIIFLQEDEAKFFYFVRAGWVKLFRETLDGEEAIIDVITSGHIFGNHSIFEDFKYSYSAEVVEDAVLYQFPIKLLQDAILKDQILAFNMMKLISARQKKHRREIEHLSIQNTAQRIGCFLLRLCKNKTQQNLVLHLPYDKSLIASRLGMKAETFSRALSKLREEVGISVQGSTITISSVGRLAEYTCSACSDSYPCEDVKV